MAFLKIPKQLKFGKRSLRRPALMPRLLRLALLRKVTSAALKKAKESSSMMITKTGGAAVVDAKLHRLVIHVAQIPKCFTILVKINKT